MDILSLMRMLGGLALVLGLLGAALWLVRRFDIRLPGRVAGGATRRLDLIERLPIDARRSVALIRRDGREHMILLSPEGTLVIETDIVRDARDEAADAERAEKAAAEAEAMRENIAQVRESFATLVERANERVRDVGRAVRVRLNQTPREDARDA